MLKSHLRSSFAKIRAGYFSYWFSFVEAGKYTDHPISRDTRISLGQNCCRLISLNPTIFSPPHTIAELLFYWSSYWSWAGLCQCRIAYEFNAHVQWNPKTTHKPGPTKFKNQTASTLAVILAIRLPMAERRRINTINPATLPKPAKAHVTGSGTTLTVKPQLTKLL